MSRRKSDGPRVQGPSTKGGRRKVYRSGANGRRPARTDKDHAAFPPPELGERYLYPCPICISGNADATYTDKYGLPEWLVGCFTASCRALNGHYLTELAERVGAPSGAEVKYDPRPWIARLTDGHRTRLRSGKPESLPSKASIAGWHSRLLTDEAAFKYLTEERGLKSKTIRAFEVGYGERHGRPPAFMVPVRDRRGALLTVVERFWPKPWTQPGARRSSKNRALYKRGSHFFPAVPKRGAVLLVGGLFDALIARQEGLPAITATTAIQVKSELAEQLEGRRVAVAFDVSEEDAAERVVAQLRGIGAEAWVVPLDLPNKGDDVNDWFTTYGRTSVDLRRLINDARREAA